MASTSCTMIQAADVLDEAVRAVPAGYWLCCPQGTNQYPQRVMSARGTLVAECYQGNALAGETTIARYLALAGPEVTGAIARLLHGKGTEWEETIEWKDGCYYHAGGCGGVVGENPRHDGCDCFDAALEIAQAVLDAAAYVTSGRKAG